MSGCDEEFASWCFVEKSARACDGASLSNSPEELFFPDVSVVIGGASMSLLVVNRPMSLSCEGEV